MTSRGEEVTWATRGVISGARVTTGESCGGREVVETGLETTVQGAGEAVRFRVKEGDVTADC